MTRFRPCIDLHAGQVKQIAAARAALAAWPGGLQVGGGIRDTNAAAWIAAGAAKVIVTSFLFEAVAVTDGSEPANDGTTAAAATTYRFSQARLEAKTAAPAHTASVSSSSSPSDDNDDDNHEWVVAINKWQTLTDMRLSAETIAQLAPYCSEFLVHAADVEGLQGGIDAALVARLAAWCGAVGRGGSGSGSGNDNDNGNGNGNGIPVTYAGGARQLADLALVERLSGGRVDLTIGSALDCFGGTGVRLADCIAWNNADKDREAAAVAAVE
ncbi:5-profar isomerase [Niveomyces insectorum RCEF 264]|uniref:5-profar isomerase n=1 Tax=Niveomyces insectorum RCEF 264 TaxID=1081102 RepID=A0A167NJ64_9HYPO|nr:5-profar isomerase [Niveomyces insectorum RCEF 264]